MKQLDLHILPFFYINHMLILIDVSYVDDVASLDVQVHNNVNQHHLYINKDYIEKIIVKDKDIQNNRYE